MTSTAAFSTGGQPSEPANESIGVRLRRLRRARGLSQRELSAVGISYAYISRIEAGARRPSVKAIRMLARRLGVSPEYLEYGVDIDPRERRELRLAELELELRLSEPSTQIEGQLAELAEESEREGDHALALKARSAFVLAALARGSKQQAGEEIDRLLASDGLEATGDPSLVIVLGRSLARLGRRNEAVSVLEAALTQAIERLRGKEELAGADAVRLAATLADIGDRAAAETALGSVAELIHDSADPRQRVRGYRAQALMAAKEHDLRGALHSARKAVGLLDELEDIHQLALAQMLYAKILLAGEQLGEAGERLQAAEGLLGVAARPRDLALLRTLQALLAARGGDGRKALAAASVAVELASGNDPRSLGLARWALAEACVMNGESARGEKELGEALTLLQAEAPSDAAEALGWWARVLREQGREDEAFAALERALSLS